MLLCLLHRAEQILVAEDKAARNMALPLVPETALDCMQPPEASVEFCTANALSSRQSCSHHFPCQHFTDAAHCHSVLWGKQWEQSRGRQPLHPHTVLGSGALHALCVYGDFISLQHDVPIVITVIKTC